MYCLGRLTLRRRTSKLMIDFPKISLNVRSKLFAHRSTPKCPGRTSRRDKGVKSSLEVEHLGSTMFYGISRADNSILGEVDVTL